MQQFFSTFKLIIITLSTFSVAAQAQDFTAPLNHIYDEVIEANAQLATQSCRALEHQIETSKTLTTKTIKPAFTQLVKDWKAVETTYILGDLNDEFLDTPRYIDIFRQGKEDWQQQLNRAIESQSEPQTALFKHSLRSINALEYILFQDEHISPREQAFAKHITHSICHHLDSIHQGYQDAKPIFLAQQDKSLSYIIHSLSSSIFTTRDWRIGDVRGLSRKYKNKADMRRAEYFLSQLSAEALRSIFSTQQEVFGTANQTRLNAILAYYKEEKLAQEIQQNLQKTLDILKPITTEQALFEQAETIHRISHQLYQQYYISIVAALPIVAKVLDADGD